MSRPATHAIPSETDAHARGGRIIEHFRLDATPRLLRALGLGAAAMGIGSVVVAIALLLPALDPDVDLGITRRPIGAVDRDGNPMVDPNPEHELFFGLFGLTCIVGGGATTLIALQRVLREDSYLALRTDGAFFQADGQHDLIRWDEVEEVRFDPEAGAVRFERHDGSAWLRGERFFGISSEELARRARDVRRKALFGLL